MRRLRRVGERMLGGYGPVGASCVGEGVLVGDAMGNIGAGTGGQVLAQAGLRRAVVGAGGRHNLQRTPASVGAAVPPILDGIVQAATQMAGNFGPFFAVLGHKLLNQKPFLEGDGVAVEQRLQILVVTLAALLGRPAAQQTRDADPVCWAVHGNDFDQAPVLLGAPGPTPSLALVLFLLVRHDVGVASG